MDKLISKKSIGTNLLPPPETHLTSRDKERFKIKSCKQFYKDNGIEKKARIAIQILDKIDFS